MEQQHYDNEDRYFRCQRYANKKRLLHRLERWHDFLILLLVFDAVIAALFAWFDHFDLHITSSFACSFIIVAICQRILWKDVLVARREFYTAYFALLETAELP